MPATHNPNDDKNTPKHAQKDPKVVAEKSDINYRAIIKFGMWMTAAAFFIHGSMWVMFRYYLDKPDPPRPQPPSALAIRSNRMPPKPQLQRDPLLDLQQVRRGENEVITKGVTDPKTGASSIPIETAMEELAQKGLPCRPQDQVKDDPELRLDSSSGRKPEKRVLW
jgi:hypothetical protein